MFAARVIVVLSGLAFSLAAEPRRCCFDKQYAVRMGVIGQTLTDDPSTSTFIDVDVRMGYDHYTDRQGTRTTFKLPDGSTSIRYELKDFAARREYISENNRTTCTYHTMEFYELNRPLCIPDNATFMGSSVIGYGHQSMNLNTWSFMDQLDANTPSQIILSVTQDHCVPVTESIIGVYEGIPIEETLFFTDYHPGLEHLERLEPPQNCQPASTPRKRRSFSRFH